MAIPRFLIIIVVLLCTGQQALAADGPAEAAYREARQEYHRLLSAAGKQQYRDQWNRVIDGLLGVHREFPGTSQGAKALYLAGKAGRGLYEVSRVESDARQAVACFLQIPSAYPSSSLADDALLLAGEIEEEILEDRRAAWQSYRQACERYPGGDMADLARQRCAALAAYAPPGKTAAGAGTSGSAQLQAVRFWSNPDYTRVVLDLSAATGYTSNFLPGDAGKGIDPRLYVDVEGAEPAKGLADSTPVDDGLLKQIRTGRPDPKHTRVVLDLFSFGDYKIFSLRDPFRIVIDIAGDDVPVLKSQTPRVTSGPPSGGIAGILDRAPKERPLKVRIPENQGSGLRRIVVDAGHGGKDPGAIGPRGTYEKTVTLALARELARRLEQELGCEVILTRDGDVFLPLEERTAMANKVGADLFISIHANANRKSGAHGTETYYLNFSKNDQAVAVAARENGTSLKQVGDLEMILLDLMANSKINESSRLAAEIQRALVEDLDRHYRSVRDLGVRQGPFYVLLGATMPSVLVETAFISNPREEARLGDPEFRARAARGIVRGVRNYATALNMIAVK